MPAFTKTLAARKSQRRPTATTSSFTDSPWQSRHTKVQIVLNIVEDLAATEVFFLESRPRCRCIRCSEGAFYYHKIRCMPVSIQCFVHLLVSISATKFYRTVSSCSVYSLWRKKQQPRTQRLRESITGNDADADAHEHPTLFRKNQNTSIKRNRFPSCDPSNPSKRYEHTFCMEYFEEDFC